MEKTVILHIGTFKTGTSSIQKYLIDHGEALAKHGVFVPKGQLIGHHELPLSLIKEFTSFRESWPSFTGDRKSVWDNVFDQIKRTKCRTAIISSENFCDIVNEHARHASAKMARVIREYFSPYAVKVIVYLRRLDLYVNSIYGETIKVSPSTATKEKLLSAYVKHKSIHIHPSYYLDFFSDLFGKSNMEVRLYSRRALVAGDVVADFLSKLGLSDGELADVGKIIENVSLSAEGVVLKRLFNVVGIPGHDFNWQVAKLLIDIEGILSRDDSDSMNGGVLSTVRGECDYIREAYGIDIGPAESRDEDGVGVEPVPRSIGFLVALVAMSIRQNRTIMAKLDELQKSIMVGEK